MTPVTLCKLVVGYSLFIAALNMMPTGLGYAAGAWTRGAISAVLGWAEK